jgi:cysteine desulfurase
MSRIYLDHNATTPPPAAVVEAVAAAMRDLRGNPSSVHLDGQRAKAAVDEARHLVAALIGGAARDLVFTSGGTESDNLAIRGVAEATLASGRRHLVASTIEHEAVINTVKTLTRRGWTASWLRVGRDGVVDPAELDALLQDDTALVSVMLANNEIGTVQPVADLVRIAQARGVVVHTDAVQAAGKVAVDATALGVDLLSISAHKLGGPQGVGALWIRPGTTMTACQTGGRQERGRRAGTENVPAIVGFGVAARIAREKVQGEVIRLGALRDRLENGLLERVPDVSVNGRRDIRVPNTSSVTFDHVDAEALLIALDLEGIAVSTGSACSSGTLEPSHVLRAMGHGPAAQRALRFSLGADTTPADIDRVIEVLPRVVERLRALARAGAR